MSEFIDIAHPRFSRAQRDIFIKRVAADCMVHECRLRKHDDRLKLDACCQYGVDADIGERDAILGHKEEIATLLRSEVADKPWFKTEESIDEDFPSGRFVRTERFEDGCLFLAHDLRGCAIHRASIENGWDFRGVKPHVCRLFPLSYDQKSIVMSDDYSDYSCAFEPNSPTVYRVGRDTLADVFGADLVVALDAAEAAIASELGQAAVATPSPLPVVQS